MDYPVTLSLLGALAVSAVFCGWRGALPPDPLKGPRMIPWRPLMVLSATGVFLMLVHLVTMAKEARS